LQLNILIVVDLMARHCYVITLTSLGNKPIRFCTDVSLNGLFFAVLNLLKIQLRWRKTDAVKMSFDDSVVNLNTWKRHLSAITLHT